MKKIPVFDIKLGTKEKDFVNDCPNANYIMDNGFYPPSGNTITNEEIDFVSDEVKNLAKN